jgi:hypothetical protein
MKLALALFLALGVSVSAFAATGDVGASIKPNAVDFSKLATRVLQYADVTLSSTQMDTLNATPVTLVAAPGSGKVIYLDDVFCYNTFVSTQFELGSGTLDVRYGSSSGSLAAQFSNEFVEYNSSKGAHAYARDSLTSDNTALVLYASSDVTAGNGNIKCRATYRTVQLSDI